MSPPSPNAQAPTPLDQYQALVSSGALNSDAEQLHVISLLDDIASNLVSRPAQTENDKSFFSRLFKREQSEPVKTVQGLYLWGGVGRGKTRLTDLFYDAVDIPDKTRLHFHRYMKFIHDELKTLQNVEDPLVVVADNWISKARLLVLDEIHVNDITDAMLLGRLMTEMFSRGMTLVSTSNVSPDGLYRDGLQRARFIPAIEQIKAHTLVYEMGGETDYRLRVLENADIYLDSSLQATNARLKQQFDTLALGVNPGAIPQTGHSPAQIMRGTMTLNSRELRIIAAGNGVLWVDFESLCNTPRSTHDYIAIATLYHTVILAEIPVLDDLRNDAARRFVNLIDELYDRHVNLIVSAEAEPEQLYTGDRLAFEYQRAASRLREMQTLEYLAK